MLCLLLLLFFTEVNTFNAKQMSIVLFRRRPVNSIPESHDPSFTPVDEEKLVSPTPVESVPRQHSTDEAMQETVMNYASDMTNVFTWQHLRYDVPVRRGEVVKLLDDVSGYVAPGKLTALMGESGAGKVGNFSVSARIHC